MIQPLARLLMLIFTACFLGLLCNATLYAQDSTGKATLRGTVTDDQNEPLVGAIVTLKGTGYGAATKLDGNYLIPNIAAGDYAVQVSLIGYATVLKTNFTLRAGEARVENFKLKTSAISAKEITVVGEKPLIDIEQATSTSTVTQQLLDISPLRDVKEIAATQVGVVKTPDGVHLRGSRSYETGFYLDGISVRDPLAGTGFGLDLSPNSLSEVEITTGGAGAAYGDVAGVVSIRTRDGDDTLRGDLALRRDNLFFDTPVSWNTSIYQASLSGRVPVERLWTGFRGDLTFFASGSASFTDEFFETPARQLQPLDVPTFFAPANDNRWDGLLKLTYKFRGERLTLLLARSLAINQNTQALQITGNDLQLQPGYQYAFSLIPDSANVYTHDTNIEALTWQHLFSSNAVLTLQASRFFTSLRTEVSGRAWRPAILNEDLDPKSVVTDPTYFNPNDPVVYVLSPSGLYNGGIAPLWHDHYAEEYTFKSEMLVAFSDNVNQLTVGAEAKVSEYQWVDIIRPWIGAPYTAGAPPRRLGESADIWQVRPTFGALYLSNQFRYEGLIATIGVRAQVWFPGKFLDEVVADTASLVPDEFREPYLKETSELFGRRARLRLLPRVNIAFPLADNYVISFNYSTAQSFPHPRFLYSGLDSRYSDGAANVNFNDPLGVTYNDSLYGYARLGNPSLKPETTTSYELGLRAQINPTEALILTVFYRDKLDLIVSAGLQYRDPRTGRLATRLTQINEDFGRTRGLELTYKKRIGKWFDGTLSAAYQVTVGQSNSSEETAANVIRVGGIRPETEFPLAWDRPVEIKTLLLFQHDAERGLGDIDFLNHLRLLVSGSYTSGLRYTPFVSRGTVGSGQEQGRTIYQEASSRRFGEIGESWLTLDLSLEKDFFLNQNRLTAQLQVRNLLNRNNAAIVNPTTGRGYEAGDPLPIDQRDPRYTTLNDTRLPPQNPARYLPPLQILIGASFKF